MLEDIPLHQRIHMITVIYPTIRMADNETVVPVTHQQHPFQGRRMVRSNEANQKNKDWSGVQHVLLKCSASCVIYIEYMYQNKYNQMKTIHYMTYTDHFTPIIIRLLNLDTFEPFLPRNHSTKLLQLVGMIFRDSPTMSISDSLVLNRESCSDCHIFYILHRFHMIYINYS